jgi:hypothetical protein
MLGCFSKSADSGDGQEETNTNGSPPVVQPSDEPASEPDLPDDVDSDGFTEEDGDCDDWDPAVYPGATEIWNGLDDDCNGWVDQDGRHGGTTTFQSVGIYQSQAYSFSDNCSGTLIRDSGIAVLDVLCDIDTGQEQSLLLLGEQVNIHAEATVFGDESWSGTGIIEGTGGDLEWDTTIDLTLEWSPLAADGGQQVTVQGQLDTFYLDGSLQGVFLRTE